MSLSLHEQQFLNELMDKLILQLNYRSNALESTRFGDLLAQIGAAGPATSLAASNGTVAAPSVSFSAHPALGLFYQFVGGGVGDAISFTADGVNVPIQIHQYGMTVRSGKAIDTDGGGSLALGSGNAGFVVIGNAGMPVGGGGALAGVRFEGPVSFTRAAMEGTTVGGAGGASALPATPAKYLTVTLSDGNHYRIPCYL